MNMVRKLFFSVCVIALLPGMTTAQSTFITDSVRSPGLAGNALGDNPVRPVFVYLPPSYRQSPSRRFPVLYLLHGASSEPKEWWDGTYQGMDMRATLDSLIGARAIPEFIVVMPDANNKLGASFYTNSPVSGRWEDFIVRDVVGYIDRHYRTSKVARNRVLVGHSMGGYGALAIAFNHPSEFGLIYAVSPCCLDLGGPFSVTSPLWRSVASVSRWQDAKGYDAIILGLAAAIDGDRNNPRLTTALPVGLDGNGVVVAHADVAARWMAHLPPQLARAMVKRGEYAPAIMIEAGSKETALLSGVNVLRARLDSLGIQHTDSLFTGGHIDQVRDRFTNHMLPLVGAWFVATRGAK